MSCDQMDEGHDSKKSLSLLGLSATSCWLYSDPS